MTIYLLSGLGADERLFRYLDFGNHNVIPIKWIRPLKTDSIEDYAKKLAPQINTNDAVVIGMSFGGILAVELAKIVPVKKTILISAAANAQELPALYRFAGKLKIHRLITGGIMKRSHRFLNWVMGATDPVRRELLGDMLRDTDTVFTYWAVDKIVTWKSTTIPANIVRIHGSKDIVLPLRTTDYLVQGGGHLIVANRAKEVTGYIREILAA